VNSAQRAHHVSLCAAVDDGARMSRYVVLNWSKMGEVMVFEFTETANSQVRPFRHWTRKP
jgi:hypothetical protein